MNQQTLKFDTAQIGPLRALLQRISTLKSSIGDIVQFRVVVDANYVVQSLIYRVRHPDRGATAVEELIKATIVDVYAPRWLDTEMISAVRQAAEASGVPQAALWSQWLEFRSLLKWDDSLWQPGPESSKFCDPKDHPYIELARKITADGILSKDAHITQMGGHLLTLDFMLSARSYARATVTDVSIRVLGTIVPAATIMALATLLQYVVCLFSKLPKHVKALLLIGVAVAFIHPGSRKWIADRYANAGAAMEPVWCGLKELVTTLAATSTEARAQATLHLCAANRVISPRRNTKVATPRMRRRRKSPATSKALVRITGNLKDT